MQRNLSLYLDLLRTGAAFLVFLGHARMETLPSIPAFLGIHFSEAVAAFFVLSGMVIGYVTDRAETDWKAYAFARVIRIMPVVFLSLVVTYSFDNLGFLINRSYYEHVNVSSIQISASDIMSCLTFTNEFWTRDIYVGSNHPIWSIGFEVWYYVLFGFIIFSRGKGRTFALLIVASICGPKIILYFPLWLIGVATYHIISSNRVVINIRLSIALYVVSIVIYAVVKKLWGQKIGAIFAWEGIGISLPTSAYFDVIGLAFALNILAFDQATRHVLLFGDKASHAIRWLSGATFTLYLMHGPILLFLSASLTRWHAGTLSRVLAVATTPLLVLALAELAERRKRQTARLVRMWVSRWPPLFLTAYLLRLRRDNNANAAEPPTELLSRNPPH